jgi:hypothetical protein
MVSVFKIGVQSSNVHPLIYITLSLPINNGHMTEIEDRNEAFANNKTHERRQRKQQRIKGNGKATPPAT